MPATARGNGAIRTIDGYGKTWMLPLHGSAGFHEQRCRPGSEARAGSVQRVDKVPLALWRGYALTHWSNGKPFSRPFVRVRKRFLTKSHENRRACRRFSIKSRRACGPSDASLRFVDGLKVASATFFRYPWIKEPLNNSAARWRLNFSHLLLAEISIYLQ